ncbi:MAG: glycosyltransferase family 39 protein [Pyrinomonadaceae bacterium]
MAFAVRLGVVFSFPAVPIADAADYHRLASALVSGEGYVSAVGEPTAWRPPGYPAFLFIIYSLFGPSVQAAYCVQAAVGALTVLLLMALGALTMGKREAFIGGLLAVFYPGLFWLPRVLLSENLSLPLLLGCLCLAIMVAKINSAWLSLALGILLGASALVRGANVFVGGLIVLGLALQIWLQGLAWRKYVAPLALIGLGGLIVMLPWTGRNFLVFRRFVPLSTQEGITLYASYWPPINGTKRIWGNLPGIEDEQVAAASRLSGEAEISSYLQGVVLNRLWAEPSYFFKLWPEKIISTAAPFDWEWFPHKPGTTRSVNVAYLLILVPALFGALYLMRYPILRLWPLAVLPLSVLIQTLVFYGSPRFRLPAELIALLLVPVGLNWAAQRMWPPEERGEPLAVAGGKQ